MRALSFERDDPTQAFLRFCLRRWQEKPSMTIEDAYKWIYQAELGGEHAVEDETGPARWLEKEWLTLEAPPEGEAKADPLKEDGSILRINLRPYKAEGGTKEEILTMFLGSALRFRGEKERFIRVWNGLALLLSFETACGLTVADWHSLDDKVRSLGYPALHHSPAYEEAYRPAYRVVLSEFWNNR